MLHYVRGDGGMVVVPVDTLKDWLRLKYRDSDDMGVTEDDATYSNKLLDKLLQAIENAEMEG